MWTFSKDILYREKSKVYSFVFCLVGWLLDFFFEEVVIVIAGGFVFAYLFL